jgi:hypothetical protein
MPLGLRGTIRVGFRAKCVLKNKARVYTTSELIKGPSSVLRWPPSRHQDSLSLPVATRFPVNLAPGMADWAKISGSSKHDWRAD